MISILHDIRAEELQALADDMGWYREYLVIAQCESRSHNEHYGELWQCEECLHVFCGAEEAVAAGLCADCRVRLPRQERFVSVA